MADCFDQIIGLTPADNDYVSDTISVDNKKSNSGLYIDALDETAFILKTLDGVTDATKNVNTFFTSALKSAVDQFREKLFMELGTRYTVKQPPYRGLIGQSSFTTALASASSFIAAVYEMQPLKGGLMQVNNIYVAINQSRTVQVEVWKAYVINGEYQLQGTALRTIDVNAVANTATSVAITTPLLLPLTDDSSHVVHYLFLMDRTAGFQAMDTKASCGCDNQRTVERWLLNGGVEGADKEHLRFSNRRTGTAAYTNGITVDANILCNDTGFVCENYGASPFVKTAMEHAVLYQTASNLLTMILKSDVVNRFALTKREQMATDAAIMNGKFKNRMGWIAENMNMRPNNCFVCNNLNEISYPYKAGIRF